LEVGTEVNRFRRRIGRSAALTFTVLTTVVAGCSLEQEHGYVQSSDQSLSFRHPADWQPVDLDPVAAEWVVGVDASADPSEANLDEFVLDAPFVVAQVYPLDASVRDTVSQQSLRQIALTDGRDPLAGDDPSIRLVFHDSFIDGRGFEGHHMRFEVDLDSGTAVEEQLAVLDPERTRVQRVRVACSLTCFDANTAEIEEIFDSIRLRS
jgi:hypothetical protein